MVSPSEGGNKKWEKVLPLCRIRIQNDSQKTFVGLVSTRLEADWKSLLFWCIDIHSEIIFEAGKRQEFWLPEKNRSWGWHLKIVTVIYPNACFVLQGDSEKFLFSTLKLNDFPSRVQPKEAGQAQNFTETTSWPESGRWTVLVFEMVSGRSRVFDCLTPFQLMFKSSCTQIYTSLLTHPSLLLPDTLRK